MVISDPQHRQCSNLTEAKMDIVYMYNHENNAPSQLPNSCTWLNIYIYIYINIYIYIIYNIIYIIYIIYINIYTYICIYKYVYNIYINIYIYIYINFPVNAIVRLPHPRSGDSQGQGRFLAPPR